MRNVRNMPTPGLVHVLQDPPVWAAQEERQNKRMHSFFHTNTNRKGWSLLSLHTHIPPHSRDLNVLKGISLLPKITQRFNLPYLQLLVTQTAYY